MMYYHRAASATILVNKDDIPLFEYIWTTLCVLIMIMIGLHYTVYLLLAKYIAHN
jgi:hypothetical protein